MPIDKSWIDSVARVSAEYFTKIDEFLDFAYANKDAGSHIYCPCKKCKNRPLYVREVVRKHLRNNGFLISYKLWTEHGETIRDLIEEPQQRSEVPQESDGYMNVDMARLVEDAFVGTEIPAPENLDDDGAREDATPGPTECSKQFLKLIEVAKLPLYPDSKKHTALSFVVRLLQAKSLYGWTNHSFKELLEIFVETLPDEANLPKSYYQAQKLVDDLGFTFTIVDACPNSCMLFQNENENLDQCAICKTSRWRETNAGSDSGTRRAAHQARYFPLTLRLQRLFATTESATLMKWHNLKCVDDGVYRHPADSLAWKHLDVKYPSFGAEMRNVRLGIASDGFNVFGNQNLGHSAWPVVLVPYNLPPMQILKQSYIYLSVLIDEPKGPGDKIDVYRRDSKSFHYGREFAEAPATLTGDERLSQIESNGVLTCYKREDMIERHKRGPKKWERDPTKRNKHNWKKKSIFYELPYWKDNLLPHCIDVMHVEKNFAENVLYTIMGVKGRSKDNLSSRRDLEVLGIRLEYHVKLTDSGAEYYERAEFEMDDDGKDNFLLGLSKARMSDGSCSSIARRVNLKDRSIGGLKSHEYRILLQQLIPLCARSSLPRIVVSVLINVGKFFKVLSSKVNSKVVLEEARQLIILTLCDIEKIFPPSFLDIMEHLPIHLVEEVLIGGAVQFRWMYPIERFLLTLKNYVRQNACPKASLAKCYVMEECMNFCAQYLDDVETKSRRPPRRKEDDDKLHSIRSNTLSNSLMDVVSC